MQVMVPSRMMASLGRTTLNPITACRSSSTSCLHVERLNAAASGGLMKLPPGARLLQDGLYKPCVRTQATANDSKQSTEEPELLNSIADGLEDTFAIKDLTSEMTDTSRLGQRGELYLAGQLLLVGLVLFPPSGTKEFLGAMGAAGAVAGLSLIAVSLSGLGRSLSALPEPRAKGKLVTDGIYSIARHPMYTGLLLAAFGIGLATHNDSSLAWAVGLLLLLDKKAEMEETLLLARFPEYEEYKGRVNKFLPWL